MDTVTIKSTQFSILSPEEIEAHSVAEIEYVEMYENKMPKIGSLSDPRMGCIEKNMLCYTCEENMNNCPGHFGHITLNCAVYHISFLKTIKKILECICHKCSRFRILPTDSKFKKLQSSKTKFQFAWEICKNKTVCEYSDCEAQILPLRRIGMQLYYDVKRINKNQDKIYLFANEARNILQNISNETCELIGLNPHTSRPEWMIITILPVPPPCVRPSVKMDIGDGRGEDDLTHVLTNIIKYNNELKKCLVSRSNNNSMISKLKEQLQYNITTYFDNDVKTGIPQNTQRGARPIKSIISRLKGKEGRIRGNCMGKRVDFSARTVITGDPTLSIDEVGIPISIASNLTFPERVFGLNLYNMQKLVDYSPKYPSAKYVIKENGTRIDLRFAKIKPILKVGDVVERHLVDGDTVLFNRQPTLHKMSMMTHKVKVVPFSTFRLNVNVCASYNADFDGDEMNIHVPQTLEAIAELQELSTVSKNLISAQANKPVNSLVQDSLTSIRKFTLKDNFLTRDQVMQLMTILDCFGNVMPEPCILKPKKLWSGKQILSLVLPKITFTGFHSTHPDDEENIHCTKGDTRVYIRNGELLSGIICKKTVGTSSSGILHIIFNDFGYKAARKFLDQSSQLLNEWMLHHGFSVGIGDAIVSSTLSDNVNNSIQKSYTQVDQILNDYKNGNLKSNGNLSVTETKESMIQNVLSKARDESGRFISSNSTSYNNIKQMVDSGAKGSVMNICQISACVGQQIVEGKRLTNGFKDRTLPHYSKYDDSPESRGFVQNNFLKGLTPQEMFFHAMGGREGIIDTAVKTSTTGYIQRRLVKAMEDLIIKYDNTVRDSNNNIVQFVYGDDGVDAVHMEWNTFPTLKLSLKELKEKYYNENVKDEWDLIYKDYLYLHKVFPTGEDRWTMPMCINRMIVNLSYDYTSTLPTQDLDETYVFTKVLALRKKLVPSFSYNASGNNASGNNASDGDNDSIWEKSLFGILLSSCLCTRQIIQHWKLSRVGFDILLNNITDKYFKSLITPGENVGVVSAQSIGEPATQMTLNTFHLSGTGNKSVTSGIPRLQELINATKNIKTPSMKIYFEDEVRFDYKKVQQLQYQIEHTCLKDVLHEFYLHYDVEFNGTVPDLECAFVPDDEEYKSEDLYPWVLVLKLDRKKLYTRNISIHDITETLYDMFTDTIFIQSTSINYKDVPLVYIRFVKDYSRSNESDMDTFTFLQSIVHSIVDITICGVPDIEKTFISENNIVFFDNDGNICKKTEYLVETDGINIQDVSCIKYVNTSRLICNDPQEINNIYGIEICRKVLLDEIKSVISDAGTYINNRHLLLLSDVMTNKGYIMSITRHGVGKNDANPLSKCTFEQSVDILFDATKEGKNNKLSGISENIMLGQLVNCGTGMVHVLPKESGNGNSSFYENIVLEVDDNEEYSNDDEYEPLKPSYLKKDFVL